MTRASTFESIYLVQLQSNTGQCFPLLMGLSPILLNMFMIRYVTDTFLHFSYYVLLEKHLVTTQMMLMVLLYKLGIKVIK